MRVVSVQDRDTSLVAHVPEFLKRLPLLVSPMIPTLNAPCFLWLRG